jgi:hypothetical protein
MLTGERLLRPNRWAVFWAANLVILLICYMPGIVTSGPHKPSPLQLAEFVVVYLGIPVRGLLLFPYPGMFNQPTQIVFSALCGVALLIFSAVLCWHARFRLRARNPAALVLLGFSVFALISAIVTGWGRANFPPFTVGNGNASRYTIFGAYLVLGELYYVAAGFAEGWWRRRIFAPAATLAALIFTCLSAISYGRAINIYNDAHEFNQEVASAYSGWGIKPTPYDQVIYPDRNFFINLKANMQRLELGPYSNRPFDSIALPIGGYQTFILLSRGGDISQDFTASRAGLKDISVTLAKPNGDLTAGIIQWQLSAVDTSQPVARGRLKAANIQDWEVVRLKLPYLGDSEGREYRLSFAGLADASHALAMPLYAAAAGQKTGVAIANPGAASTTENLSMNLVLDYAE